MDTGNWDDKKCAGCGRGMGWSDDPLCPGCTIKQLRAQVASLRSVLVTIAEGLDAHKNAGFLIGQASPIAIAVRKAME